MVRSDCEKKLIHSRLKGRKEYVSEKLVMEKRKTVGRLLANAQSSMRWEVLVQVSAGSPHKLGFWSWRGLHPISCRWMLNPRSPTR